MTDWVRLWHDMPTDPKWRGIAKRSGQTIASVIAVFNFVMVNASANASERGRTHNLFADDIGCALDMESEDVEAILAAMRGKVMDGDGRLTGWGKRQPKREDSGAAERARAWRERQRTQHNAPERPDTDTDTDTDKKETSLRSTKKKEGSGEKMGCRVPDNFWPNATSMAKADELGVPVTRSLVDSFLDYWRGVPGAKGRKSDWQGTFRNSLNYHAQRKPRNDRPVFSNRDSFAEAIAFRRKSEPIEGSGDGGAANLVLLPGLREGATGISGEPHEPPGELSSGDNRQAG